MSRVASGFAPPACEPDRPTKTKSKPDDPRSQLVPSSPMDARNQGSDKQKHLWEILEWIGTWRVASATAISVNYALTAQTASRLLQAGCEAGVLELVRLKREDPVYRLTADGQKQAGIRSEFRIVRRNMDYLSRRAHIAAILSVQAGPGERVTNPNQAGPKAPAVKVRSGGSLQTQSADLLVEACDKEHKPTAVVLITSHQSLQMSDSLCRAWHESRDVARAILCAMPDVLEDLQQIIDNGHLAGRIEAMPMPLSDYAKTRRNLRVEPVEIVPDRQKLLQMDGDEIEKDRQKYEDERKHWTEMRDAARRRWKEMSDPFQELSDTEWDALEPILRYRRPKRVKHWYGIPVNRDRDVINTLLLCEYLGRHLSEMRLIDGYASGEMCLHRTRQWPKRRLNAAWERLAEISAAGGSRQKLIAAAQLKVAGPQARQ